MQPLFTVHAGEYLVGSYIEKHFRGLNVWIPSKDTGVDLLVTNGQNQNPIPLQVKFSKDYLLTHVLPKFHGGLRACGYWTINADKLEKSPAHYWILVLPGFKDRSLDNVIVPKKDLLQRLRSIHGQRHKAIRSYLWVTESNRCWETRGLNTEHLRQVADGEYECAGRDFTKWFNDWTPVELLNH